MIGAGTGDDGDPGAGEGRVAVSPLRDETVRVLPEAPDRCAAPW